MDIFNRWMLLPVSTVVVSTSAYATVYLTVEQAQQLIFPGAMFNPKLITLTDEQMRSIKKMTGTDVRNRELKLWQVASGGYFIIDEVVGKHELITYALGLNADGSMRQVEIMDYRENYGYEIRNKAWRQQFVGKRPANVATLDDDIKNISGATLSCQHVTDGIKRLLALYEIVLKSK